MVGGLQGLTSIWLLACIAAFIACATVDWRTRRIPNRITHPFLGLALGITFLQGQWPAALWGGLLVGGILLLLRLVAGRSRAGMGDAKLAALGGLLLGPQVGLQALLLATLAALVVLTPQLLLKKVSARQAVPFGPYLALGFCIYLVQMLLARYGQ